MKDLPESHKIPEIKSQKRVFCSLPWYSLQTKFNGEYGPCCHIHWREADVPKNKKELMSLWNSKEMRELRADLVSGNLSPDHPCYGCYDRQPTIENSNNFDDNHMFYGMGRFPKRSLQTSESHKIARQQYVSGDTKMHGHPQHIYMISNELCNYECIQCTQHHVIQDYESTHFINLLEEIGFENLDQIGAVGGETLITKDVRQLLDYVEKTDMKGCNFQLTTNGSKLGDKRFDRLDIFENLFLVISMDGYEETYESIRVKSDWKVFNKNMLDLSKRKKEKEHWNIWFNSVIMKSSLYDLIKIIDYAKKLDFGLFFHPIFTGMGAFNTFQDSDETRLYYEENFFDFEGVVDYNDAHNAIEGAFNYAKQHYPRKETLDSLSKALRHLEVKRAARNLVDDRIQQSKLFYNAGLNQTSLQTIISISPGIATSRFVMQISTQYPEYHIQQGWAAQNDPNYSEEYKLRQLANCYWDAFCCNPSRVDYKNMHSKFLKLADHLINNNATNNNAIENNDGTDLIKTKSVSIGRNLYRRYIKHRLTDRQQYYLARFWTEIILNKSNQRFLYARISLKKIGLW